MIAYKNKTTGHLTETAPKSVRLEDGRDVTGGEAWRITHTQVEAEWVEEQIPRTESIPEKEIRKISQKYLTEEQLETKDMVLLFNTLDALLRDPSATTDMRLEILADISAIQHHQLLLLGFSVSKDYLEDTITTMTLKEVPPSEPESV